MGNPVTSGLLPWQLKTAYALWIAIWIPSYIHHYEASNLLWMCDVANILLLFAICWELPLLLSAQAVAVLLVQVVWSADYFSALLFEMHLIGGTEYMFDTNYPFWMRAMSLFHVAIPPLLLWCLYRMGYDRRGPTLQTLIICLVLPATYVFSAPEQNVNWLYGVFGFPQTWMPTGIFLIVLMLAYPLVLFFPTHLVLKRIFPPPNVL